MAGTNRIIVLGILPAASAAESAINNLAEEGVSERQISLVTQAESISRAIIADSGPLRGLDASGVSGALQSLGLSQAEADVLAQAVQAGKALLAVEVTPEWVPAVTETLQGFPGAQVQQIEVNRRK